MSKKRFWLGMLVMALVFGMTVVGCASSRIMVNSELYGTWVREKEKATDLAIEIALSGDSYSINMEGAFNNRGKFVLTRGYGADMIEFHIKELVNEKNKTKKVSWLFGGDPTIRSPYTLENGSLILKEGGSYVGVYKKR